MTVVLTGFEPFDGQTVNASWEAVQDVAAGWDRPERLVTRQLPVSFARAPQVLRDAVDGVRPCVVVCVGEASGRSAVGIERVAANVADASIPDNDGSAPVDQPLVPAGPTAYLTGLPLRACLAAAAATGVPVEISNTAGTHVCNAVFYALLDLLGPGPGRPGVRAGFVHVPRAPEQVPDGAPALAVTRSARAVAAVVRAALDAPARGEP